MKRLNLLLFALLAFAATTNAAPLADRLPGNAAIYIEWAGHDASSAVDNKTPFGRILERPAVKRFISELTRIVALNIRKEAAADGEAETLEHAMTLLDTLWRRRVAIDVLGVTMSESGPAPEAVIAIDFSGDTKSAETFIVAIEQILAKVGLPPAKSEDIDGKSFKTIVIPFVSTVRFGLADDVFLVMFGTEMPAKVFAALDGKGDVASQDERYIAAMNKIGTRGRDTIMITHLDTATILKQARDIWKMMSQQDTFPPPIQNALAASSLDRLNSITATVQVDGDRFRQSMFIALPTKNGRPKWMHQKPVTDKQLQMVPADVTFAKVANFQLTDLFDGIVHVVSAIGADQEGQFKNGIAHIEGQLGLRICDDILAKFDGGWIVYISPNAGGLFITGLTMMVESSDTAGIEQLVTRLIRAIDSEIQEVSMTIRELDYRGHTVRHIAFEGEPIPVAPAWTTHDGYLIAGLYPQIVTHAIDFMLEGDSAKSIKDNPEFQNGLKHLPKNASSIVYADTKSIVLELYRFLLPLSTALAAEARAEGFDVTADLFPSCNDLTADLIADVAVFSSDNDGVMITSNGPLPMEMAGVTIPATIAMSASVLIPSLSRARTIAKRTVSMSNARQIVGACILYAFENNDQFPPSLQTLVDKGLIEKGTLRSPLGAADDDAYVYLPGGHSNLPNPAETVIVYEHLNHHDNEGTVIGFADGHVEWVNAERFTKLLKQSKATLESVESP